VARERPLAIEHPGNYRWLSRAPRDRLHRAVSGFSHNARANCSRNMLWCWITMPRGTSAACEGPPGAVRRPPAAVSAGVVHAEDKHFLSIGIEASCVTERRIENGFHAVLIRCLCCTSISRPDSSKIHSQSHEGAFVQQLVTRVIVSNVCVRKCGRRTQRGDRYHNL